MSLFLVVRENNSDAKVVGVKDVSSMSQRQIDRAERDLIREFSDKIPEDFEDYFSINLTNQSVKIGDYDQRPLRRVK